MKSKRIVVALLFVLPALFCSLVSVAHAEPPAITTQPEPQFSGIGSNVTFEVTATGSPPLAYRWQFNGTNLTDATNDTLILNNLTTNYGGYYSVIITNSSGSVTSDVAVLVVFTFTVTQPDSVRTPQDKPLIIPAASLLTNDTPALAVPSEVTIGPFTISLRLRISVTNVSANSAQGGTLSFAKDQLWVAGYSGPAIADAATALAVDGNGNVYVTGYSVVGSGWLARVLYDYATVKYASDGTPVWTNCYNGSGPEHFNIPTALAVDTLGNVYVTGRSAGLNPFNPHYPHNDYATLKYATDGTPLWTNRYNGPAEQAHDNATALAVDSLGNVYVTGYSAGTGTSNNYDYATIKYAGDGTELWVRRYDGPGGGNDYAQSLAIDGSGGVYVTGTSRGLSGYAELTTLKYASDGTPVWTNRYHGPASRDEFDGALAYSSGNVYVVFSSAGVGSGYDYATLKYASDGTSLWTNRYNSAANADDYAKALTVDREGSVYVTGFSFGSGGLLPSGTVKYSSGGTPLWTNFFGSINSAIGLAVDNQGNIYVTGHAPGPGAGIRYDYMTVKFASDGTTLWSNRYNGPGDSSDFPSKLCVDSAGNVYVAGTSYSDSPGGTESDYATVKYSPDGQITYNPPRNFHGTDTFTYTVTDNLGIGPDATGVVTVTVTPPFRFNTSPQSFRFTANGLWLQLDGTDGVHPVVIYASTNFTNWKPVFTNPPVTGSLQFLDSSATNFSRRFYRGLMQ